MTKWRRASLAVVLTAASAAMCTLSAAGAGVATQLGPVNVAPGPRPGTYALTWATAAPTTGYVFDVQKRYSGATTWTNLIAGTTARGKTFTPTVPGPYALRTRLRNAVNGSSSKWSPTVTLTGNWSMFQSDKEHTGVKLDPTIGVSTAARLTVKWKRLVAPGSGILSSPAVAFNRQLHKPLVYSATTAGTITAHDLATGAVVWTSAGNGSILSSPAVVANSVYIGTESHYLLALDATTGAVQCAFSLGGTVISSPVVGQIDSTGPVVFFGDDGTGGATSSGHEWAINGVGNSAGSCTLKWFFDDWNNKGTTTKRTGTWSSPALTADATGRPLLVFGSANPDDSVYALDARNGTRVWRFQAKIIAPDQDVGAAPTIGRPGLNGFPHGVVYVAGKNNVEYALDLLTGHQIWQFNMKTHSGGVDAGTQSAAALVGSRIVVPYARYVFALNATTGAQIWRSAPAAGQYFSSPSVSGAPGDEAIVIGDDAGVERVYRVGDGSTVFQLKTQGAVYSSSALAFGSVLFGTTNGYLYALG